MRKDGIKVRSLEFVMFWKIYIKPYIVIIVAILLMIAALVPYMWTFAKFGISSNSDQWDHLVAILVVYFLD